MYQVFTSLLFSFFISKMKSHQHDKLKDEIRDSLIEEHDKPYFVDLWGYVMNWTDPEEGWSELKRKSTLHANDLMIKQMDSLKQYSKHGYKKMKIPQDLLSMINEIRSNSKLEPETCLIDDSLSGCHRYRTELVIPMVEGLRHFPGRIFGSSINVQMFLLLLCLLNQATLNTTLNKCFIFIFYRDEIESMALWWKPNQYIY